MSWDEALRLFRVSMRMDITGIVLASNEYEAKAAALAKQWAVRPVEMPDSCSLTATEEVIERVTGTFPVK